MFGFNRYNALGPVYTKRQPQLRINTAMTLATQLPLKTIELLQNGLQPYSGVTLFVSIVSIENCIPSIITVLTLR